MSNNKPLKMKLKSDDIRLIPISDDVVLFFHAPTLQLYPLKDKRLISFLQSIKEGGIRLAQELSDYKDINNFIINKIVSAPSTSRYNEADRSKNDFTHIVLPISSSCNLSCPYCFVYAGNGINFRSYTQEDVKRNFAYIFKNTPEKEKQRVVYFFGGEPLLNFPIMEFTIKHLKETYSDYNICYSITSNGTILNNALLNFIKTNNIFVLISLDGPDNEYNLRHYKNGKKSIHNVIQNIRRLKENGIHVEIRATIVNNNPYLLETYKYFEEFGVPFTIMHAFNSENRNHLELTTYDESSLNNLKEQYNKLCDYYLHEVIIPQKKIYNREFKKLDHSIRYRFLRAVICSAGYNYYTITADGDIFSCTNLMNDKKYKIGDIYSNYLDKDLYTPISVDEINECKKCWLKYLCSGGCLAQKVTDNISNRSSMDINHCKLEEIRWEFNLKIYYYNTSVKIYRAKS